MAAKITHSPGPWKRDTQFWLVSPNGHYVVRVGASTSADAKLIAAAPELLSALEEFVCFVRQGGQRYNEREMLAIAAAAIAKATGGDL